MNKNPFVPTPTYTPPQPPLPPGPPPPQPGQPDYAAWWAASAGAQQAHAQPPVTPQYNPQWSGPQAPRPPTDQSALYANYGYGAQQQGHWRGQQQQQQQAPYQPPQPQPYHPAPQVPQPPQQPPGYNPYQPAAGYPQQYVPQAPAPPQPMAQPAYPHPPPPPQQQFFNPHMPPQNQVQQGPRVHHTPPQHMPPAKRQRFDGPNNNRNQQHALPAQPQFQPPPPPPPGGGSFGGPNANRGPPSGPGQMGGGGGGGRGGGPGGRGGPVGGQRGGRGGSFTNNRGGAPAGRGRGTGSGYIGGSGGGGRGGGSGNQGNALRGHGSRAGNFNQNRRNQGSSFNTSGFQQGGSFRNRNQGQSGQNKSGQRRQESGSQANNKESSGPTIVAPGGKEENKRTLTDFKIVGLEIPELEWSWGALPVPPPEVKQEVKTEPLDPVSSVSVKDEVVDDKSALKTPSAVDAQKSRADASQSAEVAGAAESQKIPESQSWVTRDAVNGANQPPSRMRIYFDTPVTADDSKPIPHNSGAAYGGDNSSERKGKRKKLEDDDGDREEGRGRPPPPQMTSIAHDDRSSVAASVAPSVAETTSEADWLMAAIVEGEEEAQATAEMHPEGGDGDGDEHIFPEDRDAEGEEDDLDADAEGEVEVLVDDGHGDDGYMLEEHFADAPASAAPAAPSGQAVPADDHTSPAPPPPDSAATVVEVPNPSDGQGSAVNGGDSGPSEAPVSPDVTSSSRDNSLFEATEETSANQPDFTDAHESDVTVEKGQAKSLQAASAEPTLLVIEETESTQIVEQETQIVEPGPGENEQETQNVSEIFTSSAPVNGHLPEIKEEVESGPPSANRLSISYASGNRRLVVDAEVVSSLKLYRQAGKIEVGISLSKSAGGIKGVLVESLSDSKTYVPLADILASSTEADGTVPPFSKLALPASVQLIARLDTRRPLSEPKWAKSGDIQEWLKSMLGSDDAAGGWGRKIHVVDPDPPPTIWTVLEGWANNSPVGLVHERQRFLKTHMTETDNMLEILLRLVRGERATAFQNNAPVISAPSVSGVLATALIPGSAHGAQQTHVSLAVLALFRMTVEYAQKLKGEEGRGEVEARMSEIIRCLPSHLVYKSLDGIFKEWRAEKKGGR